MVAVIGTGHSIRNIFFYNEQKVEEGVADCIMAGNYPLELDQLNQNHRLNRLVRQAELNEKVKRNSVHISLNFSPAEQFSRQQLQEMATEYMDRIGFGDQPYLVYKHNDSGHPHIHIVSIKVRSDGSRIDTQNIGRNQSETARKEMEIKYGLIKAEDMKLEFSMKPANAQKVYYGRMDSRRAIANVLAQVLDNYKYTSLPELNAILKQYNISADRGSEESAMFKKKGLHYRILDELGNKIGTPIKASSFYNKPTLSNLEERFAKNVPAKKALIASVRSTIDLALLRSGSRSLQEWESTLKRNGIDLMFRQNAEGRIYGITYIDHKNKVAFNGSDLGKAYSAKAVLESFALPESRQNNLPFAESRVEEDKMNFKNDAQKLPVSGSNNGSVSPPSESLLDILLQAEQVSGYVPYELSGKKKRKKKGKRI